VVVVCAAAVIVGGVHALLQAGGSPPPITPPLVLPTVPITVPYFARSGPNGTTILTDAVDLLTLAVPAAWKTPAADQSTLVGQLNQFAAQTPSLAPPLQSEIQAASEFAIRVFAYQPVAPHTFISIISFASPGINALTPASAAVEVAAAKTKSPNVAVSAVQLPVGTVLQLQSSYVSQNQPVVAEELVLISGGRTMLIEMVSETDVASYPPVFAQIAQSLRLLQP
jgi:hypothetical protein